MHKGFLSQGIAQLTDHVLLNILLFTHSHMPQAHPEILSALLQENVFVRACAKESSK